MRLDTAGEFVRLSGKVQQGPTEDGPGALGAGSEPFGPGTEFECLGPALTGPIVLGFSLEDPGAVFAALGEDAERGTLPTVVHARTIVGKDAQDAIDQVKSLVNQYTK